MFDWSDEAERLCTQLGIDKIREASVLLSTAYREARSTDSPRLSGDALLGAYLAVRFPATMAAALAASRAVALSIANRAGIPDYRPESLLDLGAGCGAGALALQEVWPTLNAVTAIEQLPAMVKTGRQLLPDATWRTATVESITEFLPHDIVLLNYALGETKALPIERAWQAARQLLLIVEPGTPHGFATILNARQRLLDAGASIVAPCPANAPCPAAGNDWCHFAARLNRSALHRRLKGGTLSYEDEKFSYLAAWRGSLTPGALRVIRHPLIEPGRIQVEVCAAPARGSMTGTKRDKERFRIFRKIRWGDELDRDAGLSPNPPKTGSST